MTNLFGRQKGVLVLLKGYLVFTLLEMMLTKYIGHIEWGVNGRFVYEDGLPFS